MPKTILVKVSQYMDDTSYEIFPGDTVELTEAQLKAFEKNLASLLVPFVALLENRVLRPQCITVTLELET